MVRIYIEWLKKKIKYKELINIHSNKIYSVQFLGFIPGFAYLGTLTIEFLYLEKKS